MLRILKDPEDITVVPGKNAVFKAEAAGGSQITYLWQKPTDNGATWTDTTSKNNQLTIETYFRTGKYYKLETMPLKDARSLPM